MCIEYWKKLKPWIKDGIIGFVVGLVLYVLRIAGITLPYLSDWEAQGLSLGTVGITMVVAYTIAGVFIGELIGQATGKRSKK
ncbi:MAG: hypothetical protein J7K22_03620 [Nanoarchaeota archaeon]|nr:hypothetical protein [Nanoarchaeota archaeon]